MRDKIIELEGEVKVVKREVREKDETIKNLDHKIELISMEKDVRSSRSDIDLSGMQGVNELEA